MSLTFAQLKTEVFSGGFNVLDDSSTGDTRVGRWINAAYKRDIVSHALWSFRETTATGAAPLAVSDLGPVATVIDTARQVKLYPRDRRDLADAYPDLTTTGSPSFYYFENGVVKTYPAGGTLSVRYWKVPADLSVSTDVPIVPADYHELIVFGALRRAHMDNQDFDAAAAYKVELQEGLESMLDDLLFQQADEAELVVGVGGEDWGRG